MAEYKHPSPPPTLSKETVGVWKGWGGMGDREVVREAAAKGHHVKLAITYLSTRQNWGVDETEIWFTNEVITWSRELLNRKQIHKASHILNNIGLDPSSVLCDIFYTCTNEELRGCIWENLAKTGKLTEHQKHLWEFLKLIQANLGVISKYKLKEDSIKCLDEQTKAWKSAIAATLFLETYDFNLAPFLSGDTLWKQLLANNDFESIKAWIKVRFNSNISKEPPASLLEQFKKFPITNEMLNGILSAEFDIAPEIANEIYNEFAKFGIFRDTERTNFPTILERLKNSNNISNLYQIIASNTSQITLANFLELLIDFCLEMKLFNVLNCCLKDFQIVNNNNSSPYLNLIANCRELVRKFDEQSLCNNILKAAPIFSDDLPAYFDNNPTILLGFLFFTKDFHILDAINRDKYLYIDDVDFSQCLGNLLEKFPIINTILDKKINRLEQNNRLTMYNLMETHLDVNAEHLFAFRFNRTELPHFNCDELKMFAYAKQINYLFYLNESRPSIASKTFIIDQFANKVDLKSIMKKVHKLAFINFKLSDVSASCVAFLEMIGFDSRLLRTKFGIINVLLEAHFDDDYIVNIMLISESQPEILQNLLETILIERTNSCLMVNGGELVEMFLLNDILMKFSKLAGLKLPELFLKHCANNNLWLAFLIFAQVHNYPIDQVNVLVQHIKNPNLLEHVAHAVANDIQIEEVNVLIRERDSRQYFLSKIGVRKSVENLCVRGANSSSQSSQGSGGSSETSSECMEIDTSNIKATLLQVLIRCHNSTDPPKALLQACQLYRHPLLAVIASSYEPDSLITNWLNWLAVSCEICETFTNYESVAVSANLVRNLLVNCLKNGYPNALLESFEIFLPENCLKVFIDILINYVKLNFNSIVPKLELFKDLLKTTRRTSVIPEPDHEISYLNNKIWVETTSLRLLSVMLDHNCTSLHQQILIVENMCDVKIWQYFSIDFPNFANLLKILQILPNSGFKLDIGVMFENNRQAVMNCVNLLLSKNLFENALKVAQIEDLPPDVILVKQCQHQFVNRFECDHQFWQNCDDLFRNYSVAAECVIDFLVNCSEKLNDSEKFPVLNLACVWAKEFELANQYELEMKMWLAFINTDEKLRNFDKFQIDSAMYLYQDLLVSLETIHEYKGELNMELVRQLERVLNFALNHGDVWLALKLQKMFGCTSGDLEILQLSFSLAEGLLTPYQLNTEQRLLITNSNYLKPYNSRTRTFFSGRYSSGSTYSHSPGVSSINQPDVNNDSPLNDTLAILKLLSERLHNGIEMGQNVFMTYRISINIEIPYHVVIASCDCMKMLKDALGEECMNKLDVVHDFVYVYKWSKNIIADFVCEELVNATLNYVQSNADQFKMWDLMIDQDFPLILQLLQDNCSILGHKIFSYSNTLHKSRIESTETITPKELALIIELLIRAHDCFTADCNMAGISIILHKCQEVIQNLIDQENWKQIVRLLTGVARYTEMNYVFQILMENDQFEFLLRKRAPPEKKGSRKHDSTLKIALLEYLKKYCPDNRDLYKIVALHFTLFSEVAVLWEREAQGMIKNLISISKLEMQNNKLNPDEEPFVLLENTDGTKICLNKVMENYTHATEFHLQGEKLMKALNSAKQAELIALQISLLNELPNKATAVCLLELNKNQIESLISTKLSFEQTQILVEANNYYPDWTSLLYNQYIIKNDSMFLDGFMKHLPLTDTVVHEMSLKFMKAKIHTVASIRCMKDVLSRLSSVYMKYRIASELGFTDMVEELINGGQLAYLKDTVWKRGYKN